MQAADITRSLTATPIAAYVGALIGESVFLPRDGCSFVFNDLCRSLLFFVYSKYFFLTVLLLCSLQFSTLLLVSTSAGVLRFFHYIRFFYSYCKSRESTLNPVSCDRAYKMPIRTRSSKAIANTTKQETPMLSVVSGQLWPFLKLPVELRQMIYQEIVGDGPIKMRQPRSMISTRDSLVAPKKPSIIPLLLVNRSIHDDFLLYLQTLVRFQISLVPQAMQITRYYFSAQRHEPLVDFDMPKGNFIHHIRHLEIYLEWQDQRSEPLDQGLILRKLSSLNHLSNLKLRWIWHRRSPSSSADGRIECRIHGARPVDWISLWILEPFLQFQSQREELTIQVQRAWYPYDDIDKLDQIIRNQYANVDMDEYISIADYMRKIRVQWIEHLKNDMLGRAEYSKKMGEEVEVDVMELFRTRIEHLHAGRPMKSIYSD